MRAHRTLTYCPRSTFPSTSNHLRIILSSINVHKTLSSMHFLLYKHSIFHALSIVIPKPRFFPINSSWSTNHQCHPLRNTYSLLVRDEPFHSNDLFSVSVLLCCRLDGCSCWVVEIIVSIHYRCRVYCPLTSMCYHPKENLICNWCSPKVCWCIHSLHPAFQLCQISSIVVTILQNQSGQTSYPGSVDWMLNAIWCLTGMTLLTEFLTTHTSWRCTH